MDIDDSLRNDAVVIDDRAFVCKRGLLKKFIRAMALLDVKIGKS